MNNADDLSGNFRVQRGGRFIKQQHLRLHHQRAGNRDALLLTAGKVQRITIAIGLQT